MLSTQISIEVEVEVVKPHFEVDTKTRMVDIINMKANLMEVDEETLEEEEVEEVVLEVIEANNQISIQTCRAPKFLVDSLEGPSMRQCGRSWNLEHDPDFQH